MQGLSAIGSGVDQIIVRECMCKIVVMLKLKIHNFLKFISIDESVLSQYALTISDDKVFNNFFHKFIML
jgi:hypothetical protein